MKPELEILHHSFGHDTDKFLARLNQWMALTNKTFADALRIKGRSVFGHVTNFTPPIGISKRVADARTNAGKPTEAVSARKQGEAAVRRDILQAVRPLREQDFESEKIRELIRKRHADVLEKVLGAGGPPLSRAKIVPFSADLHQRQRDRRGRVKARVDVRFATFDADAVEAYIRETQGHVGSAKGGWAAVHAALGGKPPEWVRRHSGMGSFTMDLTDPLKAYIHAVNYAPWANVANEDRAISNALTAATEGLGREIEARIERDRRKAGL